MTCEEMLSDLSADSRRQLRELIAQSALDSGTKERALHLLDLLTIVDEGNVALLRVLRR
jgi:hypothetical protein